MMAYCFFFNDTATTGIYTLSLHDALPICWQADHVAGLLGAQGIDVELVVVDTAGDRSQAGGVPIWQVGGQGRSEEHTSELQSRQYLGCRLLLEKKQNRYSASFSSDISEGQ